MRASFCVAFGLCLVACPMGRDVPVKAPTPQNAAEIVLDNGLFYTGVDKLGIVKGLAISDGKVVFAGSRAQVKAFVGPKTRRYDLQGRFVVPGFHDAHIHFQGGGKALLKLNLAGVKTLAEVLKRVGEEAKRHKPGTWIVGRGWDHTAWTDHQAFPTRQQLDRVTPNNPVVLRRVDGHVAWVNSAALAEAKVTGKTKDPDGGEIERDKAGQPTGILKEKAQALVQPQQRADDARRYLEAALARAREMGVTSIGDGGSDIATLAALRAEGKLTLRVHAWGKLDGQIDKWVALRKKHPANDPWLSVGSLKGMVDGTLGSATAALLEPYSDQANTRGILRLTPAQLIERVTQATKHDFAVNLHAIGDRAVRTALDAFAAAAKATGKRLRHRIEHLQLVHPDDWARIQKLGVIASMQPCHLSTDQRWVTKRIGAERAKARSYLWKTVLDKGVPLAFGTDWPVEPMSPLRNLYAAVTRKRPDAPHLPGFYPEQKLNIEQAIRAYTAGSAYAASAEQSKGTLAPGQFADLAVLSEPLLSAAPARLLKAKVRATMVGGKVVYGSLGLPAR